MERKPYLLPHILTGGMIALAFLGMIVSLVTGLPEMVPMTWIGSLALWALLQMLRVRSLVSRGCQTTAVMVDRKYKEVSKRDYDYRHGSLGYKNVVHAAPVMEYETADGTVRAVFPDERELLPYEMGKSYDICYIPEHPEIFWAIGKEKVLWNKYRIVFWLGVFGLICMLPMLYIASFEHHVQG